MHQNRSDKDINDVFDDILLFEENLIDEAYEKGFEIGVLQGNTEGYHLGYHRGAEIGAEIGFYLGVTEKYLKFEETEEKNKNSLEKLRKELLEFPKINSAQFDIFELLDNIRSHFKKVCAQMKINVIFPEKSNLSF